MSWLKDVILVEGLKANLISITQLKNQNLLVKFSKGRYSVLNTKDVFIIERNWSSYNYYVLYHSAICSDYTSSNVEP